MYEINLPFFKQGDDMAMYLEKYKDSVIALRAFAEAMEKARDKLEGIAATIEECGGNFEIDVMAHVISVSGSQNLIDELIKNGLIDEMEGTG